VGTLYYLATEGGTIKYKQTPIQDYQSTPRKKQNSAAKGGTP